MKMREAAKFLKAHTVRVVLISLLLLVPCFWHKRIETGDLPSHTYNAWLARLIQQGTAPGLYLARQSNNVMTDLALYHLGNLVGLRAAERIVVPASVLIFFWGAFAFIAAAKPSSGNQRAPWFLVPAIAMITYGWTFHAGFMNYYLALGLSFFAAALVWRGRGSDWIVAAVLAGLVWIAHPIAFLCLIGMVSYIKLAEILKGWYRWGLFAAALLVVWGAHLYVLRFRSVYWHTSDFYLMNGADQISVFGERYINLAWVVLIFGSLCFLVGVIREWKTAPSRWAFRTPLELWAVLVFTAAMIPEVVWLPQYPMLVGLIISRLTSITAVLGLCVLASVRPRMWHLAGLAACAAVFFFFIYQDTGVLNRMEQQAEDLVHDLPYGRRVVETISSQPDWRIWFINHIVDRACIGHCYAYANYEPASGQFRVRVRPGSPIAAPTPDDTEALENGLYVVQPPDLPMTEIYQCDEQDLSKLCRRDLTAGEKNGRVGHQAPNF